MVKFSGSVDGGRGRLIGIGLSRENTRRLHEGEPITFDLKELGLRVVVGDGPVIGALDGHVLIVAGETEEELARQMETLRHAGD